MKNLFTLATAAALAAVVGTASIAAQPGGFISTASDKIQVGKGVTFDVVNASSPAVLEVYTLTAGQPDQLVSTQELAAGATADIRLNSTTVPASDLVALLKIDGQTVDTKVLELN